MASPQVSVLLPVRDGERTVKQAVQSLTSQTLSKIEIVIVDDGSTDGTGCVLERLARGDRRIVLLRQRAAGTSPRCSVPPGQREDPCSRAWTPTTSVTRSA